MTLTLTIQYDPQTDACAVSGMPMTQTPDGQKTILRGLVYGALDKAKEVIRDFDPNAQQKQIVLATGAIPEPLTNGRL